MAIRPPIGAVKGRTAPLSETVAPGFIGQQIARLMRKLAEIVLIVSVVPNSE